MDLSILICGHFSNLDAALRVRVRQEVRHILRDAEVTVFGHDQMLRVRFPSGTILRSRLVGCCRGLEVGLRVDVHVGTPVMAYPIPYGCPIGLPE